MEKIVKIIYILGIILAIVGTICIFIIEVGIKNGFKLMMAEIFGWILAIVIIGIFMIVACTISIPLEFIRKRLKK